MKEDLKTTTLSASSVIESTTHTKHGIREISQNPHCATTVQLPSHLVENPHFTAQTAVLPMQDPEAPLSEKEINWDSLAVAKLYIKLHEKTI